MCTGEENPAVTSPELRQSAPLPILTHMHITKLRISQQVWKKGAKRKEDAEVSFFSFLFMGVGVQSDTQ